MLYGIMAMLHKISYYGLLSAILEVVFCFGKNTGSLLATSFIVDSQKFCVATNGVMCFSVCGSIWGYALFILWRDVKMKKWLALLLILAMVVSLCACGKSDTISATTTTDVDTSLSEVEMVVSEEEMVVSENVAVEEELPDEQTTEESIVLTKDEMMDVAIELNTEDYDAMLNNIAKASTYTDSIVVVSGSIQSVDMEYCVLSPIVYSLNEGDIITNVYDSQLLSLSVYLPTDELVELEYLQEISIVGKITNVEKSTTMIEGFEFTKIKLAVESAYLLDEYSVITDEEIYYEAIALKDKGEYERALELLEGIGEFEDSLKIIDELQISKYISTFPSVDSTAYFVDKMSLYPQLNGDDIYSMLSDCTVNVVHIVNGNNSLSWRGEFTFRSDGVVKRYATSANQYIDNSNWYVDEYSLVLDSVGYTMVELVKGTYLLYNDEEPYMIIFV